jgi:MarR family transcriptional regulator, 2-MHQ and catechol-resistance regulon repressor
VVVIDIILSAANAGAPDDQVQNSKAMSETIQITPRDSALETDARALRSAVTELIRVYAFRDRDRICCHDVSVSQSNALDTLVERGPVTLNDLAAELILDKSTASRIVDGLEKKGYAARRDNPESRRSILIEATRDGAALQRRIARELLREEMRLLDDFDPEVRRAAAALIGRLARAASARVDTSGGACCVIP